MPALRRAWTGRVYVAGGSNPENRSVQGCLAKPGCSYREHSILTLKSLSWFCFVGITVVLDDPNLRDPFSVENLTFSVHF